MTDVQARRPAADTVLKLPVLSRGADRLGDTMRSASTVLATTFDVLPAPRASCLRRSRLPNVRSVGGL